MPVPVTMPQLGESVTEGTVTRWLKDVGDAVAVDEPLLEVSTDKVDTEIPSPVAGTLVEIAAVEDAVVEVGGILAQVATADEASTSLATPSAPAPTAADTPSTATAPEAKPESVAPTVAGAPTESAPETSAPAGPSGSDPASANPTSGTEIVLPALGESVTEGIITRWLKNVGDAVAVDEPLLEISTDKVDTEIPSPVAGILSSINAQEDDTVEVGAVLAIVSASGAPVPAAAASPAPAAAPATPASASAATTQIATATPPAAPANTAPVAQAPAASEIPGTKIPTSPIVRKLAREQGVDLASIAGSGPAGKIRKADVLAASAQTVPAVTRVAPAAPPSPAAQPQPIATTAPKPITPAAQTTTDLPTPDIQAGHSEIIPMTRLRKVIAERMVESLQTSAQLTTVIEVDLSQVVALRTRAKASFLSREGVKLTYMPFFARATVEALREFPQVNSSLNSADNTVIYHGDQHLGFAVDTDRGLLVPVVRNAGDLTLAGMARRIADLAERTRNGTVGPDDLFGGTFTLTNTGSRGSLFDTPIINQPQVGILGTGAVVKRPVVITDSTGEDSIAIRSMAYLGLTYDHRIVDGADAARFLGFIKRRLEAADFSAELGLS